MPEILDDVHLRRMLFDNPIERLVDDVSNMRLMPRKEAIEFLRVQVVFLNVAAL